MELSDYLKIAKRWWWTLIVAAWIGGVAGYLVSSRIAPTYESSASVLVGPVNTDTDTLRASGQLVQTYGALATARPTLQSVVNQLRLPMSADDLAAIVRVTPNDITRIITIRVADANPDRATDIANTIAADLRDLAQRGGVRPEGNVEIVESAMPNPQPVAPNVSLLVWLAAFAGLVGALVVVMVIEYANRSVRDPDDVRRQDFPFLGVARTHAAAPESRAIAVAADPLSPAAADYRTVLAKIAYDERQPLSRSLLIVGADDGDGAAYLASNLAATLAKGRRRVVLVDANRRQGDVSEMFGLATQRGLREALTGEVALSLARHPTEVENLAVMPVGLGEMPEVIDQAAARNLLDALLRDADHIVVAAAPMRTSAATLGWANVADRVVLSVERHRVRRDEVDELAEGLAFVGAHLSGWVLTDSRTGTRSGAHVRARVDEPANALGRRGRVNEQPSQPGGGSGS